MLDELVRKLSLVSGQRILPHYAHRKEDDVETVLIPVKTVNPADRTDTKLRTIAKDFIRTHKKDHRCRADFGILPPEQRWFTPHDGDPIFVVAAITISWWPKPPEETYFTKPTKR